MPINPDVAFAFFPAAAMVIHMRHMQFLYRQFWNAAVEKRALTPELGSGAVNSAKFG
jgi:hypothetical protein